MYLRMCMALVAVCLVATSHAATLEIPGNGAKLSGIGVIAGWKCAAEGDITISLNGEVPFPAMYGLPRRDTISRCNDDGNNGFFSYWNWGNLGDGEHTVVAYDNGEEFARSTFRVVTTGEEFLRGASGTCEIPDFPAPGETAHFKWNESTQHLELVHVAQTQNQTRKMYWTTDGRIQRANLDGTQVETLFAGEQAPDSDCSELALDLTGGKMYWTNNCCIYRANLDGSQVETLVSEGNIDGFALDPVGNKMYWISARRLRWANLDGTQVETFLPVNLDGSHSRLFVDPTGDKLYWRDAEGAMQRANLDGTQVETPFTKPKSPRPSVSGPFALDLTKGKVYWRKTHGHSIYRANLDDGSHIEKLVEDFGYGSGLALDLAGGKIYFTAFRGDRGQLDGIYRANLDGSQVEALVTGLDDPGGLVLVLE